MSALQLLFELIPFLLELALSFFSRAHLAFSQAPDFLNFAAEEVCSAIALLCALLECPDRRKHCLCGLLFREVEELFQLAQNWLVCEFGGQS